MRLKTETNPDILIGQLDKRVPELMREAGVPGLSLALIREAQLVWAQGFGVVDSRSQEPVTTETIFEACSLSKATFAYAALKLHERGVIDLDTPLMTYLPETGIEADPRLAMITMRTVLCHTCGLPNWRRKGEPLKIRLTPGERFSYSGEGYMYLQRVIEHVTGQPGETFMQSQLLQPFGMAKSSYIWTEANDLPVALGHDWEGKPVDKVFDRDMWAAASLHSTPAEFARFMIAMMQPEAQNNSHLSATLIETMLTPHVQVNDSAPWQEDWPKEVISLNERVSWGLGWGIQHDTRPASFWHWGDNSTSTAFAVGFREEGLGVVIMTNSGKGYSLFEQVCLEAIGGEYPAIWWLKTLFS
jgi:CubicO group peptidase (beta-lactamase class C family)